MSKSMGITILALLFLVVLVATVAAQSWIPRDPFDSPLPYPTGYWMPPGWWEAKLPAPTLTPTPDTYRVFLPRIP